MSNFTGKTDKTELEKYIDTEKNVLITTVKKNKTDLATTRLMFGVGIESRPAKDDRLVVIPYGKSFRNKVAIGGINEQIDPIVEDGERRFYSTNESGNTIQINIHLKNDGDLVIDLENDMNVNAKNDIKLVADNDVILQDDTDFAVRFSKLQSEFNKLKSDFNNHTHTFPYNAGPTPSNGTTNTGLPQNTSDIDLTKIDNIKVPS